MTGTQDSSDHWNTLYERRAPGVVADDDEVGHAALAHFGSVDGARLLDLGCGTGEYSRFFAARGALVTAVDRSPVAVSTLREQCAVAGITNVDAVVADAMDIQRLGPFDLAFGSMILHHLEPFSRFVDVLAGSLEEGGRAFFYENSAMSRFLVWCRGHLVGRFGIPKRSDGDEFPLEPRELDLLRQRFDVRVEQPTVVLAQLASGYLLRDRAGPQLAWMDRQLARSPRIRRMSYLQHVLLVARPAPVPEAATLTRPAPRTTPAEHGA